MRMLLKVTRRLFRNFPAGNETSVCGEEKMVQRVHRGEPGNNVCVL